MSVKKELLCRSKIGTVSGRSIVWLVHWPSKPVTRVQIPATASDLNMICCNLKIL
jgi:hypothetical protein